MCILDIVRKLRYYCVVYSTSVSDAPLFAGPSEAIQTIACIKNITSRIITIAIRHGIATDAASNAVVVKPAKMQIHTKQIGIKTRARKYMKSMKW